MKPLLWVLPALLLVSNLHYSCFVDGAPQVPCYFIFGDSLSYSGNNNGLLTLAKANYKPYGIDFPSGPTGRFSNGRNLVDVIAHFSCSGGVNYASGAAGIREESGRNPTLYYSGARKIALFGLCTIGSIHFEMAMCNSSTNNVSLCSDNINSAVQVFNARLQSLDPDLNSNLTDAKFTCIDFYGIGLSSAAASLGSVIFDAPCCEVVRETGLCVPFKTPCQNRIQYSFWDAIHPSESSNVVLGGRAYNAGLPTDAVPFDINQLAQA